MERVEECISHIVKPPTSNRPSGGLWTQDLKNAIRVTYDDCVIEEVSGHRFEYNSMSLAAEARVTLIAFKGEGRSHERRRVDNSYPQTGNMDIDEDGRRHHIFRGGRIILVDGNYITM